MLTIIKDFLQQKVATYRDLEQRWRVGLMMGVIALAFLVLSPLIFPAVKGMISNPNIDVLGEMVKVVPSYFAEGKDKGEAFASTSSLEQDYKEVNVASKRAQRMRTASDSLSRISGGASSPFGQAGEYFMPQIIKTANVSIMVNDVEVGMAGLESLTLANFGIITSQNLTVAQQSRGSRYGNLVVRVPQDRLSLFLKEAGKLGKVTNQSQNGQDVSGEMVDLKSRVKNLKAEEKALQKIMTRSGKIPYILEVSRELARVRGQIEQGQGRLNHLKQQVSYSTVNISLSEKYVAPASGKPSFLTLMANTLTDAMEGLYKVGVATFQCLIWFGIFFLPILMVIVFMLRLVWMMIFRAWNAIPKREPKIPASNSVVSKSAESEDKDDEETDKTDKKTD